MLLVGATAFTVVLNELPTPGTQPVVDMEYGFETLAPSLSSTIILVAMVRLVGRLLGAKTVWPMLLLLLPSAWVLGGWALPFASEPTPTFQATASATHLLAGMGLWSTAELLSRTGKLSGGAWILSVHFVLSVGELAWLLPVEAAPFMFPPVLLAITVALRGIPTGRLMGQVGLRSPLDGPALAMAATTVCNQFFLGWMSLVACQFASSLAAIALAMVVLLAPGPREQGRAGLVFGGVVWSVAALAGIMAQLPPDAPSPHAGERRVAMTLVSDTPAADDDGPRIERRLARLGLNATWTAPTPTRIEVLVSNARDADLVRTASKQGHLEVLVDDQPLKTRPLLKSAKHLTWLDAPTLRLEMAIPASVELCEKSQQSPEGIVVRLDGDLLGRPADGRACGGRLDILLGAMPVSQVDLFETVVNEPLSTSWELAEIR